MSGIFGTIIVSLWTVIALPFIGYGVQWLKRKIGSAEYGEVLEALRIGVENIGNEQADKLKAALADGKISKDEWDRLKIRLRIKAKEEAVLILGGTARKTLLKMNNEAIEYLIRNLVDERAAEKRERDAYVNSIILRERAEYAKREAEYAATHGHG